MKKHLILFTLLITQLCSCSSLQKQSERLSVYRPDNEVIQYTGRIDFSNPQKPRLIGAGAYFEIKFKGRTCEIMLEDQNLNGNHNYISVAIDGKYQGRIKVSKDIIQYEIAKDLKNTEHRLIVCKATEAQNGYIEFSGLLCNELVGFKDNRKHKIEFIGDSVTCGMGLDMSELPCSSGQWYDQHNAYLAYGQLVAKKLNANWLLSSVSGIGVNRNWNSPGPTMPQVYENLYLNTDSNSLWDAGNFKPDLISVCLGTNDFSEGDGSYDRGELDQVKFIADYIQFVKLIRNRYPDAQICCLSSPMFSGDKSTRLAGYISQVVQHFKQVENDDKIHAFVFSGTYIKGCTTHPDKDEHQKIADELLPFYKKIMNW